MSSFSQWFVAYQKNKVMKQVTWVCGSEAVLVDDVVDTLRGSRIFEEWNFESYSVGSDRERDIWASLDQHPIDKTMRLVVVRHADQLKHLGRIEQWVKNRTTNPLTYVIFVSDEPALARVTLTPEERKVKIKAELLPHLAAISGKGALIECRPFTQATAKHAVSWVESKIKIRRGVAGHLLDRANGNLRLVRDAVRKLRAFDDEVTKQTIELLLSEQPRSSFVEALLAHDKKTALLALSSTPPTEYSSIIGLLDQRLDVLGTVHDMMVSHQTPAQITLKLGTMGFLAKDLMPISKAYDPKRRLALRKNLSVADEAIKGGIVEGPLQALTLFW